MEPEQHDSEPLNTPDPWDQANEAAGFTTEHAKAEAAEAMRLLNPLLDDETADDGEENYAPSRLAAAYDEITISLISAEGNSAAQRVYQALLTRTGEANPRPRIEPVRRLAEYAGAPQQQFPVIQVAGTNGKTSTSRIIASLLREHGLTVGLMTSPHLTSFTERFEVSGEPINGVELLSSWLALEPLIHIVDEELAAKDQGPITFFEALVVLGLCAFADAPVDVAVLEVGMGGTWDATNIADAAVAVFTPIDLDHTAILGSTIAEIAQTKAGIIKPGSVVVSAAQDPAAAEAIAAAAENTGSPAYFADQHFAVTADQAAVGGRQLTVRGIGGSYDDLLLQLFGSHQAENAALALAAVEAFFGAEKPLGEEIVAAGIAAATSPGRLQLIGHEPTVIVDAGHNPHGIRASLSAFREAFQFAELAVVCGVLAEKDAAGVLGQLAAVADFAVLTPINSERSLTEDALWAYADECFAGVTNTVADSVADALATARQWAGEQDGRGVLVIGSVLLAGEAISVAKAEGWFN